MSVQVTEAAAREIASIIKNQGLDANNVYLRVGVKGGGCSGFNYILDLTESKRDTDEVWEFGFDIAADASGDDAAEGEGGTAVQTDQQSVVRVICDPKSYLYLNGTEVDFKDEMMGRGFVFNNPNATNTCGCGSSFAV